MKQSFFWASWNNLPLIMDWFRSELGEALPKIEVVIEEILTNLIRHGYRGSVGPVLFQISKNQGHLSIQIQDSSPPFNPLICQTGVGVLLIQRLIPDIAYARKNGCNILTLRTQEGSWTV